MAVARGDERQRAPIVRSSGSTVAPVERAYVWSAGSVLRKDPDNMQFNAN